ncbi:4-(cytidine 5'-diphospho)-2-C-methyl-D-erythritol kinase [Rhodopirellula sallentina]|uniref:4-diphosphocytidyl-2-C-methyl-D-erythritol kinase n=1 Tax=Rhodopirellula sallentina SM41 TaxID=1263870 RepID=M5U802_9BACT|nr:4-diphosphocytidyl-2C-methyl-D-erythritol kinase [Rhodopirellula sallentina]EMI57404.1 4-diphosphocytidyl-2-C-methyl-D-erythritol kinase [Rhodopirellula sallentina SM41]
MEILGRREDGFHELDTVMVAIDWRDDLKLRLRPTPGIELDVRWLPDRKAVADQLAVSTDDALLDVPTDRSNLVYRALELVNEATGYRGGWQVELGKRIPSGAGMGGASSDAAATLRLAKAALHRSDPAMTESLTDEKMASMAATLGSDVPFFLGKMSIHQPSTLDVPAPTSDSVSEPGTLARALGRGEKLTFYDLPDPHRFVVIYPPTALSTAAVYSRAKVSDAPKSGLETIKTFIRRSPIGGAEILYNALAAPASGLSPHVNEALECLRKSTTQYIAPRRQAAPNGDCGRADLYCQMTGSGSACFAWLTPGFASAESTSGSAAEVTGEADVVKSNELAAFVRESLAGGALVNVVATCSAAPEIHIA